MNTTSLLDRLAHRILEASDGNKFTRIGFDGVDTAGKTFLADALAKHSLFAGREIIRGSIDGFHNPREIRYKRGKTPEGYYRNSFQYPALRQNLLEPLSPSGSGIYCRSVFDYRVDEMVDTLEQVASAGAILLFDGVFLAREETVDCWELLIFLRISFEEMLSRALKRDTAMGSPDDITHTYTTRYIPGEQLYFSEAHPEEKADIVIENEDYTNPSIVKW